ncbi:MAG: sulfur oxidation c-type cytochrome SoxX [Hyphomicrobiales bacterium]
MMASVIVTDSGARAQSKAPLELGQDAAARPWKRYPGWPAADYSKYNTLGQLASAPAPKGPRKIVGPVTGDAANGAKLVADRTRGGSCLACHVMGPAGNADLPGNVAPDLSEIGNAGREDEWLYNYVFDARVYNPETVMPPWGSHGFFSEAEINDIVAFLKTLKSPAVFRTALDNPEKRPPPVEKRDNLDPLENPGMWAVDKGQELWKEKSASGFSCNTCHSDPAASFKTWAASMPKWEPSLNKVLGVEEFVTRHAKATIGVDWLMETDNNRAMSVYLHFLANGTPIKVDTASAEAKAAIARGMELTKRKVGALNMACTDCHGIAVNKWIRGRESTC